MTAARGRRGVVRAAVVGCGRVGSLLEEDPLRGKPCTHAGFWSMHPRTRLVSGCDLRADRRARFCLAWGIGSNHVYEDYHELFAREELDAVSISTWTDSHAEITIAAARAGVKVILCEKPMAVSMSEAAAMVAACKEEGALLAIHHERRWQGDFRDARARILAGRVGEIRTILGAALTGSPPPDWHASPQVAGGGPFLHDGTHLVDAVRYLGGEIAWVSARAERADPRLGVEDTLIATLGLQSGASGYLEGGGRRGYFHFGLEIQGSKGRIRIGNEGHEVWEVGPSTRYSGFTEFRRVEESIPGGAAYPYVIDEILDAHEHRRPSISSGEEGTRTLEAVLAAYESARTGREVALPLDPQAPCLAGIFETRWR